MAWPLASPAAAAQQLQFLDGPAGAPLDDPQLPAQRAGHQTLYWSEIDVAAGYELRDDEGRLVYRGFLPQAFVSGLPDGQHRFVAVAVGEDGEVLARSEQGVIVTILHWNLTLALTLASVGAAVVAAMVVVLWIGSWRHRQTPERRPRPMAQHGPTAQQEGPT